MTALLDHSPEDLLTYKLRPYQETAVGWALARMRPGWSGLLVAPTGSGKTVCGAAVMKGAMDTPGILARPNGMIMFLAHREELIGQTYRKLLDGGIVPGVIRADDHRTDYRRRVQVASLQTLVPRLRGKHRLSELPVDLILVDEAHHAAPGSLYRQVQSCWPGAPVLGLTATPFRADGEPLGDWFNDMLVVTTPSKLLADGHLVPLNEITIDPPDMSGVRRNSKGEFNEDAASAIMVERALTGCPVAHWMEHGRGRPTLGFAVKVEDCLAWVAAFRKAGVRVDMVADQDPDRARKLALFQSSYIEVLFNVGVFLEGTDLPFVSCMIDAKPTQSLGLYMQMRGRGTRPFECKSDCLVLDHAGNFRRHGDALADREFALTSTRPDKSGRERKGKGDDADVEAVKPGVACKADNCPRRILAHEFVWRGGVAHCPACHAPQEFEKSIREQRGKLRPAQARRPSQESFL